MHARQTHRRVTSIFNFTNVLLCFVIQVLLSLYWYRRRQHYTFYHQAEKGEPKNPRGPESSEMLMMGHYSVQT